MHSGHFDRGEGNALAAEHDGRDRSGTGHVIVRGDDVNVLDAALFEVWNDSGEVGDCIGGAAIEVDARSWDACGLENVRGFGGSRRDPNFQGWIFPSQLDGMFFSI